MAITRYTAAPNGRGPSRRPSRRARRALSAISDGVHRIWVVPVFFQMKNPLNLDLPFAFVTGSGEFG